MTTKKEIKELLCYSCGGELELYIESKELLKAKLVEQQEEEKIPTFEIAFEDESEIEYTPYFKCSKCNIRAYEANKELSYDDTFDMLIFPAYDPDTKLGYTFSPVHQYPFAPDLAAPKEEPPLPTIKKASAGEEITETKPDPATLMEGLGWD